MAAILHKNFGAEHLTFILKNEIILKEKEERVMYDSFIYEVQIEELTAMAEYEHELLNIQMEDD